MPSRNSSVSLAADVIVNCLANDGLVAACGNGGSAAQAQHFVGELVGRFREERRAYRAVSLCGDIATLTAIANDYGYANVFVRQVDGLLGDGDVLVGLSTSGDSANVWTAVMRAKDLGAMTIGLVGSSSDGASPLERQADVAIVSPCQRSDLIQEDHLKIIHYICYEVERKMCGRT